MNVNPFRLGLPLREFLVTDIDWDAHKDVPGMSLAGTS